MGCYGCRSEDQGGALLGTSPVADQAAEPSEAIRRLRASMQAGKVPTPKPL